MNEEAKKKKPAMSPTEGSEGKTEKQVTMTLPEAMEFVRQGKKITRLEWANEKLYCSMADQRLKIRTADKKMHEWMISDGDIEAEDWVVIN